MERFLDQFWPKALIGAVAGFLMGLQPLVWLLVVLMVADFATGILASIAVGKKLNSDISYRGLAKKSIVLIIVAVSGASQVHVGIAELQNLVAGFFCAHELLSIMENAGRAGIPIPNQLRDVIERLSPGEQPKTTGK